MSLSDVLSLEPLTEHLSAKQIVRAAATNRAARDSVRDCLKRWSAIQAQNATRVRFKLHGLSPDTGGDKYMGDYKDPRVHTLPEPGMIVWGDMSWVYSKYRSIRFFRISKVTPKMVTAWELKRKRVDVTVAEAQKHARWLLPGWYNNLTRHAPDLSTPPTSRAKRLRFGSYHACECWHCD